MTEASGSSPAAALNVAGLTTEFRTGADWYPAVNGVSFELRPGEVLGLVGESGCGKSTVAYSLTRLLPRNARIAGGEVRLGDLELTSMSEEKLRRLRGGRLAMIFQDPMTALDPAFRVGQQIEETLREHLGLDRQAAWQRALDFFRQVGIPAPEDRLRAYPHQLSGGMRQRVALAIAISCTPDVLIADEPTTALDVTIQAQILHLIRTLLVEGRGTGVLFITHDLGVVAQICDRVAVMYAGEIVETGDVASIFAKPLHPYTQALLSAAPNDEAARGNLATIDGRVPGLIDRPSGCHFHPRCRYAREICVRAAPPRVRPSVGGEVACVLHADG